MDKVGSRRAFVGPIEERKWAGFRCNYLVSICVKVCLQLNNTRMRKHLHDLQLTILKKPSVSNRIILFSIWMLRKYNKPCSVYLAILFWLRPPRWSPGWWLWLQLQRSRCQPPCRQWRWSRWPSKQFSQNLRVHSPLWDWKCWKFSILISCLYPCHYFDPFPLWENEQI